MFAIFVLLMFAAMAGIVLGLIKPAWVLRWGAKRTRLRAIGWYCLFTVFFFIAAGVTAPKDPKIAQTTAVPEHSDAPAPVAEAPTPAVEPKQDKAAEAKIDDDKTIHINLGDSQTATPHKDDNEKQLNEQKDKKVIKESLFDFNIKTFIKRFNSSARNLKQATIHKVKVLNKDDNSGKVHTLVSSNKNIGFIVTTNNSGIVKESTMMGSGDGTPMSGVRIILSMASYFDVFDPKITADGRGKILKGLGITNGSVPEKSTYTQKNVKYTLFNTKGAGLWLIAEPAK